jgi:hypothetical protein
MPRAHDWIFAVGLMLLIPITGELGLERVQYAVLWCVVGFILLGKMVAFVGFWSAILRACFPDLPVWSAPRAKRYAVWQKPLPCSPAGLLSPPSKGVRPSGSTGAS